MVSLFFDFLVGCTGKSSRARSPNWTWSDPQQQAFDTLKQHLTSPPIQLYQDYNQPFVLHTDASSDGLGAVLCQEQDGVNRVIAYGSEGLNPAEKNYAAHKQEYIVLLLLLFIYTKSHINTFKLNNKS